MCFGSTHACTITCINDYLNETALAAGNVTGQHIIGTCKIACAAGVPIEDTGSFYPPFGFLTPSTVAVLIIIAMIVVVVSIYYLGKDNTNDTSKKE